ncbi:MAG: 2-hydroxychromene-2-carboxylate isomerase [Pacificimonas sp.]|jgi:2-hydroxychromene-2-carboxylate isomerase|nr:2-hydroxychromene-2-carboxylate isomerase [Pacificimonas sp.]
MLKTVEFIFDFVSPNGYLAWYPLKDIAARHGAEIVVTPALLGGIMKGANNQPPMVANADVKGKNDYFLKDMTRFQTRHGLTRFRMNPHFPFLTITPLRMLIAAQKDGRGHELIELLLPAAWEDGKNLSDKAVLAEILADSDFDGEALLAATQDPAVKQTLIDNTEAAVERGVFGIPSFFVGEEMYFGKDRLFEVEEALAA